MHSKKENFNGNTFLLRTWQCAAPKANILIVHGYGEHSGRYSDTATRLVAAGYSVYSYDRRGEGESEGRRAYIENFDDQVKDLLEVRKRIEDNNLKLYIYAHSLGALITTKYLIDKPVTNISGIIYSGAFLKPDDDLSPFFQKMAGVVGRLLPWLPTVKVDSALVTRDEGERKAFEADPLVYHKAASARTGFEILKAIKYVESKYLRINLPALVMHGASDKLANPKGSQQFFADIASEDKTLHIFEGQYHEIMREPEKQKFFDILIKWLNEDH